jgi:metal-responsive CopG/Arc/MetJ family transcriptional regulator
MAAKLAKISVSVDAEVVEWIDKQIEKRIYRNRSHAFDVAGHLLMDEEKETSSPKEAAIEIAA